MEIGAQFLDLFRSLGQVPTKEDCLRLEHTLFDWRQSLPYDLHVEGVQEWSSVNVWVLVLQMRVFLTECIFHRSVRKLFWHQDADFARRAEKRLHHATFEMDTILDRILLCDVARWCPLFL